MIFYVETSTIHGEHYLVNMIRKWVNFYGLLQNQYLNLLLRHCNSYFIVQLKCLFGLAS